MRPNRQWTDWVSRVEFRGRKTGRTLVKYGACSGEVDLEKAETLALGTYHLVHDLDRLISISTKRRSEWHEQDSNTEVKPAGSIGLP